MLESNKSLYELLREFIIKQNLTQAKIDDCWMDWQGTDKTLRFGQFAINRFWANSVIWPTLFYCEDHLKAYNMLVESIR